MKEAGDSFIEECGLMGVWGHPEAANLTYLGLYAQQHRGQEGVGIVSIDYKNDSQDTDAARSMHVHKGLTLVADTFRRFDFSRLPGDGAIGHVRYTTAGGNELANVQPLYAEISVGRIAIAHNGNLINAEELRKELIREGAIFGSSSDTEVILHLIARAPKNISLEEAVIRALERVEGAYSLLISFGDRMIAVRDPAGLRPLCIGNLEQAKVFASETCAFDLINAEYERDIKPGELVIMKSDGTSESFFPFKRKEESPCIFEYVYFARPDSSVFGRNVYPVRKRLGMELAREHPVDADMVVPVPDSGITASIGYSQEANIPLELGLIRNHYIGRTFIEPKQAIRNFGVKIKLNANPEVLSGKRIIVVDDSIVRGTTSKKLIAMFRKAGAKEVHLRISAPPTTDPCYYGIDTPSKEELIASAHSVDDIAKWLNVDSLAYLSREGLYRAVGTETGTMCDACFSGTYPVGTPKTQQGSAQESLFSIVE